MKRIILALLTVVSLIPFLFSLVGSLEEPQVQSQLELSQTNLLLEASASQGQWAEGSVAALLQKELVASGLDGASLEQYLGAEKELNAYQDKLRGQLATVSASNPAIDQGPLQAVIAKNQGQLNRLRLNLGLLQYQQEQKNAALTTWRSVAAQGEGKPQEAAQVLMALYQPENLPANAQTVIEENLQGWFRWQALGQLLRRQAPGADLQKCETPACIELQATVTEGAQGALVKLALINGLPLLAGVTGVLLIIGLLIQWARGKNEAILAVHNQEPWQTPWNWETIWQVLIVGFFFPSQILLPLTVGLLPLQIGSLSLIGKAFYVLGTYAAMTLWGLTVLFLSLRTFRPWPQGWFTLKLNFKTLLWGFGGYFVALPLVVVISLLNQQIWQGQGGSNPLLSLALDSQNWLVLSIFFFTAAILAPVFEEVIFRGFLLPSLSRYFPVSVAIVLSSLLFAIAHLNLSEILPLFVLGSVLGIVYSRSHNLLASMLLHGLWNSGTLLSLFILGSS